MKQASSSKGKKRKVTSCNEPDLFSCPTILEKHTAKSADAGSTPSGSIIGPPRPEKPAPLDRLFVPLASGPFDWFLAGHKEWELRRYGRQYTAKHVHSGRYVELRKGYTRGNSLWGVIDEVLRANGLEEFFLSVPFKAVIPRAQSLAEAISTAKEILGVDSATELIGFKVKLIDESPFKHNPHSGEVLSSSDIRKENDDNSQRKAEI